MELNIGAVFLSCKVLIENETPSWMYREESDKEGDSGWRVFSGSEDDEYLDNPDNFKLVMSEQLIAIDDSLKANLLAPIGSSFERDSNTGEWKFVDE